jgi:hypothetical protein
MLMCLIGDCWCLRRAWLETRVDELHGSLRVRPGNTALAYWPLQERLLVRAASPVYTLHRCCLGSCHVLTVTAVGLLGSC